MLFWAIDNLKLNKTLGLDGYTAKFCKLFEYQLAPILLEVFLACLLERQIPPSWREAKVVTIPKLDKDLTRPQSYCPISLLITF